MDRPDSVPKYVIEDQLAKLIPPERYEAHEVGLLRLLKEKPQQPQTIKMKTSYIINMVSTSLVLALTPADEVE